MLALRPIKINSIVLNFGIVKFLTSYTAIIVKKQVFQTKIFGGIKGLLTPSVSVDMLRQSDTDADTGKWLPDPFQVSTLRLMLMLGLDTPYFCLFIIYTLIQFKLLVYSLWKCLWSTDVQIA